MVDIQFFLAIGSIRRVVITNYMMSQIAGSQLVVLDICRCLVRAGAEVIVVSPVIAEPMKSLLTDVGASLVNLVASDIEDILPKQVDLLIGLHWPVVGMVALHHKMDYRHLVLLSLSPYEPIESLSILTEDADALVVNSKENRVQHIAAPYGSETAKEIRILPNSLPAEWFAAPPDVPKELNSVLFVSNRQSPRMGPLKDALRSSSIRVTDIGLRSGQQLVDEAVIDTHDAIVTIGHSVQKALARHRPVFVYDRFGGPGWVSKDNFNHLAEANFSGRGLPSLSVSGATSTFFEAFTDACKATPDLHKMARRQFVLETHLTNLLKDLVSGKKTGKEPEHSRFAALRASQAFFSVRFPRSVEPARLAPGVKTTPMTMNSAVPEMRGNGLRFHLDPNPSAATIIAQEAEFMVSGVALNEDGGNVSIRAVRDDGIVFSLARSAESPLLALQYQHLPAAKTARFQLDLIAEQAGSGFELFATTDANEFSLGHINVRPA